MEKKRSLIKDSLTEKFMMIHEKPSTRFNKNLSKVYEMLDKYGTKDEDVDKVFSRASLKEKLEIVLLLNEGAKPTNYINGKVYKSMQEEKQVVEAIQSADMYIVAADGEAGGSLYYIGNSRVDARKEYRSVAKDWRAYGLGGGDTPVCLYKYFGPTDVFDDIRIRWESGETLDYDINIEELGISLDNCDVLASEWGDI